MKSPFKFLDAYTERDQHLFFGRDDEMEELFHKVFKSNLLLVYGASGTGKTSLILCGLSTKFSKENWYSVYIRRQDDINKSLFTTIDQHTPHTLSPEDLDPSEPEIIQRLENLYLEHFKPICLIFDQLEELFILGSVEERTRFYETIKMITASKLSCTTILIIREEYFAYLSAMEDVVPMLFENRARIEPMRTKKVKEVIDKSCAAHPSIAVHDKETFLEQVVDTLSEDDLTVKLTYLQVYLDKLYKNAAVEEGRHIFDPALTGKTGKVDDVLAQFMEDQVQQLKNPELGWKILKGFISKDGTKKSASTSEIVGMLKEKNKQVDKTVVEEYLNHFLNSKILTQLENAPTEFEFTHDSLAAKTFEKLDAQERNLFDISNLIEQQYKGYKQRSVLMSKDNYLFVKPHLKNLELSEDQWRFIDKSQRKINRKKRNYIASAISIIVLLMALSAYSLWQADKAQSAEKKASGLQKDEKIARREAEQNARNFESQLKTNNQMTISTLFDNAKSYIKAGYPENALHELDSIRKINPSQSIIRRINSFKETNGL